MLSLWSLFEAVLLCLNAVCVLHEERFLAKIGWGANQQIQGFGDNPSTKAQIINLIRSIRTVMRSFEESSGNLMSCCISTFNADLLSYQDSAKDWSGDRLMMGPVCTRRVSNRLLTLNTEINNGIPITTPEHGPN